MKIELDEKIMSPFVTKLTNIRILLEDITFAAQVAFFVSIIIAIVVFVVSLTNLIFNYKTRIMEARRGIFTGFNFDEVEVMEGSNFPGYVIASSIAGFVISLIGCTLILTLVFWPVFWLWLWSKRKLILTIVVPTIVKGIIEGWCQEFVYEQYYAK